MYTVCTNPVILVSFLLQCPGAATLTVVWFGRSVQRQLQQRVEKVQNYAMRLICSKPPRTPSEDLRKSGLDRFGETTRSV